MCKVERGVSRLGDTSFFVLRMVLTVQKRVKAENFLSLPINNHQSKSGLI